MRVVGEGAMNGGNSVGVNVPSGYEVCGEVSEDICIEAV